MNGWIDQDPSGHRLAPVFGLWNVREWARAGGLRSVDLNAAGWLALLSPGVVLGLLVARLTDSSFVIFGVLGGFTIWLVAVLADNARFGRQKIRLDVRALTDSQLESLAEASRHAGIKFDHESEIDEDNGPRSLFRLQNRHRNRFRALVDLSREASEPHA